MSTSIKQIPSAPVKLSTLFGYFFPELVTAGLLYIGLEIIDFSFLACTNIASCNATLVVTNQIFHLITKVAEGFSVGMVIICGQYNGAHEYHKTGPVLSDAFWTTALIGATIAAIVYLSAYGLYAFYGVPEAISSLGVPFLRIRSLGIFLSFIYFALIGFLRGIKNTRAPMMLFIAGAIVFLFFDYALIFGKWRFPAMGLRGSAIATVLQYTTMLIGAILYILFKPEHRKFCISLFTKLSWSNIRVFEISCILAGQ
jgi:Na+-driven multidrug efflux pump